MSIRTIALKTGASELVHQYAHAVARQLGARLIIVDNLMNLPAAAVDLLMWHKHGEDSGQLPDLQKAFPRLVHLEDELGADRRAREQPGLVMPPDPEDGALVLSYSSWARRHGIGPHFWLQ